ncbi:MAG: FAD-dependent oxidoreductase, partial [Bdellovibrionales bacterium]|nr:FAD-dependent oxidoreductase [Bdellovibrionales bacterium]
MTSTYLDLYQQPASSPDEPAYRDLFMSRSETIARIARAPRDILVVGGGIHGATFARLCALHGLRTVLLERSDYANATSSRTSKMAHGGLRYLQQFDFAQVFQGIRARETLYKSAAHLVSPQEFCVPVSSSSTLAKWKLAAGLTLYDLFVRDAARRHRWCPIEKLDSCLHEVGGEQVTGGFIFSDGIMQDVRIVLESILAARQEGALCLNHASVESLKVLKDGSTEVGWYDRLDKKTYELKVGTVVNCAGPWVAQVGQLRAAPIATRVRYSQGVHLLFDRPWEGPAIYLPLRLPGKHYFICPHWAGTLVGPTDREVNQPEADPLPTSEEVDQLLSQLAQDMPQLGLTRDKLHYCYAGTRTLPVRSQSGSTATMSRRPNWEYSSGMLNLVGGKFTTATWTVEQGFKILTKMAQVQLRKVSLRGRMLPGAAYY